MKRVHPMEPLVPFAADLPADNLNNPANTWENSHAFLNRRLGNVTVVGARPARRCEGLY